MRFSLGIVLGALLLSSLYGRGEFRVHMSYDLDDDGQKETLVLNTNGLSAMWVEILASGEQDTLWSYSMVSGETFSDGEIVDVNDDGYQDLILIPNLNAAIGNQIWFYLFLGTDSGFSSSPLTIEESLLDLTTMRPSSLSLVPGGSPKLAVAFGSPVRQGLIFDIDISNEFASIKNPQLLSAPIISNGYGAVYIGGFKSNGGHYVALISPEGGKVKAAIFDVGQSFELFQSKTIKVKDARYMLGTDIQPYYSNISDKNGLLIPFGSDDTFLLSVNEEDMVLSNTSLSGKGVFLLNEQQNIFSILKSRQNLNILDSQQTGLDPEASRSEPISLTPPPAILPDTIELAADPIPCTIGAKVLCCSGAGMKASLASIGATKIRSGAWIGVGRSESRSGSIIIADITFWSSINLPIEISRMLRSDCRRALCMLAFITARSLPT